MVIGFGSGRILLHDRSWWQLTRPIPEGKDIRLDVCGRTIINIQIARGKLELVLSRPTAEYDIRLYLDWLDSSGNLVQPKFPVSGQPKAQFPVDTYDWVEIDEAFATIAKILKKYPDDSEKK